MQDVIAHIESAARQCRGVMSVAVRNVSNAADLSYNDDLVVSSASVIKVPMLVEAMRQVRDGELRLDMEFSVADEDRVEGSGVMRYLHSGTVLTISDLLTLMIIVSDNTATNVLVDVLGIESVNGTLQAMGYRGTALRRKMYDWAMIDKGLDNTCAAGEIADLLARVARNRALGGEWDGRILEILRGQQDTGKLGLLLPEEAHVANKTGSREGIMHDCGIVTVGDLSYSIAVFTKDAAARGDAILAIAAVSRAIYDRFTLH